MSFVSLTLSTLGYIKKKKKILDFFGEVMSGWDGLNKHIQLSHFIMTMVS